MCCVPCVENSCIMRANLRRVSSTIQHSGTSHSTGTTQHHHTQQYMRPKKDTRLLERCVLSLQNSISIPPSLRYDEAPPPGLLDVPIWRMASSRALSLLPLVTASASAFTASITCLVHNHSHRQQRQSQTT